MVPPHASPDMRLPHGSSRHNETPKSPFLGQDQKSGPSCSGDDATVKDTGPTNDPAASMSLLTQLLNNPLDVGYQVYSKDDAKGSRSYFARSIVILLAVILGIGFSLAVKQLRTPTTDVRQNLIGRVLSSQKAVDSLEKDARTLSHNLRSVHDTSTHHDVANDPSVALASSVTQVNGQGLIVTFTNAPQATGDTPDPQRGFVRDQDLLVAVNALWSAGAEAISVNNLRLGPATYIRTAGSVILINITPVQGPYEIKAIGDPQALAVSLVKDGTGDYLSMIQSLRNIQMTTRTEKNLQMDALDQSITRYAKRSS